MAGTPRGLGPIRRRRLYLRQVSAEIRHLLLEMEE
jgi:hypothetical protein